MKNCFFTIVFVILAQYAMTQIASAQNTNDTLIQKLSFNETQKQVNIVYADNKIPVGNIVIYLAYYDEATLKKNIISATTDDQGVVSFLIPSTADAGSVPFYFAYKETDFAKHKFALRIPSKKFSAKAGEEIITMYVDKKYFFKFHAPLQLINFPVDGSKTGNGGDIITGGVLGLR